MAENVLKKVTFRQYFIQHQLIFFILVILSLTIWSAWQTGFNPIKILQGVPNFLDLLGRMLPPDLTVLPRLIGPMFETLQMAFLGTTIPMFIALPLAFLSAVNVTPHPVISVCTRIILSAFRTVPELIWALILVSAIGLGPFAGVLALTFHSIGGLGKFFYEAMESCDPGTIEALEALGSNRLKVIWYGVLPHSIPVMLSSALFYWEYNNRASTVLGLVGAGGIGLALTHAMSDFRYREVMTCLIIIVVILVCIDRLSAFLREKII